ncbi:MAG: UMP kinase [Pseudomonadota bacterium]
MPPLRRVLIKLSGEALAGGVGFGLDPAILRRLAGDIQALQRGGLQLAVVIGGGNIFRGAGLAQAGLDRVTGDQMGMLATLMNSLALRDALMSCGVLAEVHSALPIEPVCETYRQTRALAALERGTVVLLAGGTGNPFFTTDTAASLRAIELKADLLVKATQVNGIYSADPVRHPDARFYPRLSFNQALRENLQVMDQTALLMCREQRLPLCVLNIHEPEALERCLLRGDALGSWVDNGDE